MKQFIISETAAYRFTMVINDIPKFDIKEIKLITENLALTTGGGDIGLMSKKNEPYSVHKYYLTPEEIQNLIKGLSE